MPCYKASQAPSGTTTVGRTPYATEADCLNACQEGACCEGLLCSIKSACRCQGTGKIFKGVGTKCSPSPCPCYCPDGVTLLPDTLVWSWTGGGACYPPVSGSCWNYFNNTYGGEYDSAYDFLYPQLRGSYVLTRVSCFAWRWSGGIGLDGSENYAEIKPVLYGGTTTAYVANLSKAVTSPAGTARGVWTDGRGGGLGSPADFLSSVCAGGSFASAGAIYACQTPVYLCSGTNVGAVSSGVSLPSGLPLSYYMQWTLSP